LSKGAGLGEIFSVAPAMTTEQHANEAKTANQCLDEITARDIEGMQLMKAFSMSSSRSIGVI
jgi:hypothetical protein